MRRVGISIPFCSRRPRRRWRDRGKLWRRVDRVVTNELCLSLIIGALFFHKKCQSRYLCVCNSKLDHSICIYLWHLFDIDIVEISVNGQLHDWSHVQCRCQDKIRFD